MQKKKIRIKQTKTQKKVFTTFLGSLVIKSKQLDKVNTKGQTISKANYGVLNSPKKRTLG